MKVDTSDAKRIIVDLETVVSYDHRFYVVQDSTIVDPVTEKVIWHSDQSPPLSLLPFTEQENLIQSDNAVIEPSTGRELAPNSPAISEISYSSFNWQGGFREGKDIVLLGTAKSIDGGRIVRQVIPENSAAKQPVVLPYIVRQFSFFFNEEQGYSVLSWENENSAAYRFHGKPAEINRSLAQTVLFDGEQTGAHVICKPRSQPANLPYVAKSIDLGSSVEMNFLPDRVFVVEDAPVYTKASETTAESIPQAKSDSRSSNSLFTGDFTVPVRFPYSDVQTESVYQCVPGDCIGVAKDRLLFTMGNRLWYVDPTENHKPASIDLESKIDRGLALADHSLILLKNGSVYSTAAGLKQVGSFRGAVQKLTFDQSRKKGFVLTNYSDHTYLQEFVVE